MKSIDCERHIHVNLIEFELNFYRPALLSMVSVYVQSTLHHQFQNVFIFFFIVFVCRLQFNNYFICHSMAGLCFIKIDFLWSCLVLEILVVLLCNFWWLSYAEYYIPNALKQLSNTLKQ